MPDDIFSRLFELFNQPGPVNWKLAGEVARHLAGDPQAVDPWGAEQMVELAGLAQQRLESEAPFPVAPTQLMVVDPHQWVEEALTGFGYLAEAIAEATSGAVPGMGSALAGMQAGTVVGSVAATAAGSFEAGMPIERAGAALIIGPGVERVQQSTGIDAREVHLWAACSEIAHCALFRIPWLTEHLARLVGAFAVHLVPDPEKIMEMLGGDPTALAERLGDPAALEELVGGEDARPHREALEAFLAVTSGYRHVLVRRAFGQMLPTIDLLHSPAPTEAPLLGLPLANHELTMRGARFCTEAEKRYGGDAVDGIWIGPERLPTPAELDDPVGWAARVLLDELGADI
ncbi:MAG: zinc-dependent metalloprotease [Acidimicrobiia bacterium]|nr:zinc-dependent metalloprotease [Acidimicrobiia bacterium]